MVTSTSTGRSERAAAESLIAEGAGAGDKVASGVRRCALEVLGLLDGPGSRAYVSEESMPVAVAAHIIGDRARDLCKP